MKKKHEPHAADPKAAPAPGAAAHGAPPLSEGAAKAAGGPDDEVARLRAREDDLLRALAELQNVNRRRKQEAEAAMRFAAEPLVRELLAVLDDFERALRAFPNADDPLRAGVALVHDRLVKILEKEGLEPIRPQGDPFDPELHDAIAHLPIPGAAPGTIVEVAVPGYRYRDRVLRHAKVVVAADAESVADGADSGASGGSAEPRGGL
ncbi:MAG TPA: nucleotide exchange factor GrpE [Candidatus Eisenbacteria bacterium]|nr:nucleotide exchange factor GrpE [Candidatus Eisenbacteria bacterium]